MYSGPFDVMKYPLSLGVYVSYTRYFLRARDSYI